MRAAAGENPWYCCTESAPPARPGGRSSLPWRSGSTSSPSTSPGSVRPRRLPAGTEPSPAALAAAIADLLDDLGIERPHLAGNSLGGWVAMELAKIRPVRSVTLLSPAGLWRAGTPLYCRASLRLSRWLASHAGPALSRIVGTRPGRVLVLGQMLAHPARLPAADARSAVPVNGNLPGL